MDKLVDKDGNEIKLTDGMVDYEPLFASSIIDQYKKAMHEVLDERSREDLRNSRNFEELKKHILGTVKSDKNGWIKYTYDEHEFLYRYEPHNRCYALTFPSGDITDTSTRENVFGEIFFYIEQVF